ncbi:hypothetical protein [uncultured Aquimarina sp.]|uniref:hypothetical protein n=1 Tax=uncultured Aquimarina sp. TaxID=575652 RepID=UPI00262C1171|nr:hypothetical protein [uncultured Aquimarina sp.]
MLTIKIKIAKFLIISGFLFHLGNYAIELFDFYSGDIDSIAHIIDDSEDKSESKEKDSSEKEDLKEKDKISQYTYDKNTRVSILILKGYPEINYGKSSVYLEFTTPPPEFS